MEELYFANKVMVVKGFLSYAKDHSKKFGCDIGNYYYLDNRIFTFKMENGKYVDLNGEEYQEIDHDDLNKIEVLFCNDCELNDDHNDCKKQANTRCFCIGLTNIVPLTNFLSLQDKDKVMDVIDKYNTEVGEYYTLFDNTNNSVNKVNNKVRKYIKK